MIIIEFTSLQIFNTYMQCNLGAPDGIRKAEGEDGEEIGETEEDDRLRFKVILIHNLKQTDLLVFKAGLTISRIFHIQMQP